MAKKKKLKKNSTLSDLQSKYGGAGVASDNRVEYEDQLWVPTSSPLVNYLIGGGAMYGRIIEIAGQESSGKTLMAMDLIKNAQELGGVGIFIDAELAFSHDWAELNGLELDDLLLFEENIIEVISDFVAETAFYYRNKLTANEPIVLVVDSVAALDTLASMQNSEETAKAEMGSRAKAFYKILRLRNRIWHKLGITVIFINQLRDKIQTGFGAGFGDKVTTVGGNALKFFASQRIYLETKKMITTGSGDKKRRVGVEVSITMKKNKVGIPKMPTRVEVVFDPNYDDLGFQQGVDKLVELLILNKIIAKNGTAYSFDGKQIAVGLGNLVKEIEKNEDLREDIFYEAHISTQLAMQERLDALADDNKYPTSGVDIDMDSGEEDE